jgi:hypothetical protein
MRLGLLVSAVSFADTAEARNWLLLLPFAMAAGLAIALA